MIESKKQHKLIEMVSFLEEIALERQLKLWVIDNIREVKNELEQELTEMEQEKNILRIDEILQYMKQQIAPEQIDVVAVDEMTTVSFEDIREQIQEMIQECVAANESLCQKGIYSQQEFIRETERKIRDINNVDSFYAQVCNGEQFRNYFHQAGIRLNQQMQKALIAYTEEAFQNYNWTMGKIKGLFFHIKEESLHISPRKVYQSWENKYDLEKQTYKAKAESIDCGGEAIGDFGQKHAGNINEMIETLKKKKRKYMWRPFLAATAIFVLISAVNLSGKIIEQKNVKESAAIEENTETGQLESAVKGVVGVFAGKIGDKVEAGIGVVSFLILLPLFLLFVVFPYLIYVTFVNRWYKKWVCGEVGDYLGMVINELLTEGIIRAKVEEAYMELKEEIKVQCQRTIESILVPTQMNEKNIVNNESERFLQICSEWENVKREA